MENINIGRVHRNAMNETVFMFRSRRTAHDTSRRLTRCSSVSGFKNRVPRGDVFRCQGRGGACNTVNRYLATIRNVLPTARDEWQWMDSVPKIRLLSGKVQRDRWLKKQW